MEDISNYCMYGRMISPLLNENWPGNYMAKRCQILEILDSKFISTFLNAKKQL